MAVHHVPPMRGLAPLAQLNDQICMNVEYVPHQLVREQIRPTYTPTFDSPLAHYWYLPLVGLVDVVGDCSLIINERLLAPDPPTP